MERKRQDLERLTKKYTTELGDAKEKVERLRWRLKNESSKSAVALSDLKRTQQARAESMEQDLGEYEAARPMRRARPGVAKTGLEVTMNRLARRLTVIEQLENHDAREREAPRASEPPKRLEPWEGRPVRVTRRSPVSVRAR